MKSPISRLALVAGAALSVSFAGATFAQAPQAAPAAEQQQQMKRQHDPAAHAQRLREALQLTDAQEPALQAFIASHGERRGDRAARKGEREAMQTMTTPQRLDRMAQRMAEGQQRFARHAEATKRFYNALTPDQQKAFDAMHQGKGKRGGKRMGGHHGKAPAAPQG